MEGKNKKFLLAMGIILLLVVAGVAVIVGDGTQSVNMMGRGNYSRGYMMSGADYNYPTQNYFAIPADAAKSGELAVIVNGLEDVQQQIEAVATRNSGNIYATDFSYTSNQIRNGMIVLQVPVENFENAFGSLKNLGYQIVQQSTRQIPKNNIYPMPLNAEVKTEEKADLSQGNANKDEQSTSNASAEPSQSPQDEVGATQPQNMIYPQPQIQSQDKGYIKVILADYGSRKASFGGAMMGQGMTFFSNGSTDYNKVLLVGLMLKLALLFALFMLAVIMVFRAFKTFHHHRKSQKTSTRPANKKVVHVIRRAPHSRRRIIK